MKRWIFRLTLGVGSVFFAASQAVGAADIASPAKRAELVKSANACASEPTAAPVPEDAVNIFNPEAFGKPDAAELQAMAAAKAAEAAALNKARPANENELLERIAERVMPSGSLSLNGEPLLIFGQKRVRVGDKLTITYDSVDYTVEIASIQRFTFTLRLNRAEVTRRINPGK